MWEEKMQIEDISSHPGRNVLSIIRILPTFYASGIGFFKIQTGSKAISL
jgi:hypothetical protein